MAFFIAQILERLTSVTPVDDEYFPDDPSTVDLIGVDWYPKQESGFGESCLAPVAKRSGAATTDTYLGIADFVNGGADMKAFHDKYTSANGIKFAIGEIGLGQAAPMSARVAWLENIMAAQPQMPNMIAVSWFNYYKVRGVVATRLLSRSSIADFLS